MSRAKLSLTRSSSTHLQFRLLSQTRRQHERHRKFQMNEDNNWARLLVQMGRSWSGAGVWECSCASGAVAPEHLAAKHHRSIWRRSSTSEGAALTEVQLWGRRSAGIGEAPVAGQLLWRRGSCAGSGGAAPMRETDEVDASCEKIRFGFFIFFIFSERWHSHVI
jgi:hypothetical protein